MSGGGAGGSQQDLRPVSDSAVHACVEVRLGGVDLHCVICVAFWTGRSACVVIHLVARRIVVIRPPGLPQLRPRLRRDSGAGVL